MSAERFHRHAWNESTGMRIGKGGGRDGKGMEGIATATNPSVSLVGVVVPVPVYNLSANATGSR